MLAQVGRPFPGMRRSCSRSPAGQRVPRCPNHWPARSVSASAALVAPRSPLFGPSGDDQPATSATASRSVVVTSSSSDSRMTSGGASITMSSRKRVKRTPLAAGADHFGPQLASRCRNAGAETRRRPSYPARGPPSRPGGRPAVRCRLVAAPLARLPARLALPLR